MRKINKLITIASVPMLLAAPLVNAAQVGDKYAGAQYSMLTYDEPGFPSLNPGALVGRFGYYVDKSFSIEGRAGFGIVDDNINVGGINVSLKLDNLFGAYAVGHLPVSPTASIYGLVGLTSVSVTASASAFGVSASSSDSGLSFGVGGEFNMGNNYSLNVEYVSYLSGSSFDLSAINIGFNISF